MIFNVVLMRTSKKDRCPMVNIETPGNDGPEDFAYANILNMYKTESTQGHGIQVNTPELEKPLRKMCDKISQAIYDYLEEVNP